MGKTKKNFLQQSFLDNYRRRFEVFRTFFLQTEKGVKNGRNNCVSIALFGKSHLVRVAASCSRFMLTLRSASVYTLILLNNFGHSERAPTWMRPPQQQPWLDNIVVSQIPLFSLCALPGVMFQMSNELNANEW